MTLCNELGYLQLILCGILWFPQSGFESRHLNKSTRLSPCNAMTPIDSFNNLGRTLPSLQMQYKNVFIRPMCQLSYETGDIYWKLKINYFNSLGINVGMDTRPTMK